jgi:hypothetical protein
MGFKLNGTGDFEGRHSGSIVFLNTGVVYIFGAGHISREVNDLAVQSGLRHRCVGRPCGICKPRAICRAC